MKVLIIRLKVAIALYILVVTRVVSTLRALEAASSYAVELQEQQNNQNNPPFSITNTHTTHPKQTHHVRTVVGRYEFMLMIFQGGLTRHHWKGLHHHCGLESCHERCNSSQGHRRQDTSIEPAHIDGVLRRSRRHQYVEPSPSTQHH